MHRSQTKDGGPNLSPGEVKEIMKIAGVGND
jgi:hypothetical protein